jgi:hypothetical protein
MGIKDGSNLSRAAECANHARTGKAGTYKAEPPKGPKKEPVLVNGIKAPKERGVSK